MHLTFWYTQLCEIRVGVSNIHINRQQNRQNWDVSPPAQHHSTSPIQIHDLELWAFPKTILHHLIQFEPPFLGFPHLAQKKKGGHPDQCVSVGWTSSSRKIKGHCFYSCSGHMLRFRVHSQSVQVWKATNQCFSLRSVSFPLSLPFPLSKNQRKKCI